MRERATPLIDEYARSSGERAIVPDRDGVLNRNRASHVLDWSDMEFIRGRAPHRKKPSLASTNSWLRRIRRVRVRISSLRWTRWR